MGTPSTGTRALPDAVASAAKQGVGTTYAVAPGPTGTATAPSPAVAGSATSTLSREERKKNAIQKEVNQKIVTDQRATFLGNPIRGGVHQNILKYLRAAETKLKFAPGDPMTRKMSILGKQPPGHSRHSLGVALDIDYATNPYILLEEGESKYDEELVKVYERIARFVGGRPSALAAIGRRRSTDVPGETPTAKRDRIFNVLKDESGLMQQYFKMMTDQRQLRDFVAGSAAKANFASTAWDFLPPAPPMPGANDPADPATLDAITRRMQADWVMLTWEPASGPSIAMLPGAGGAPRTQSPYPAAPRFPPIKVKGADGQLVDGPTPDAAFTSKIVARNPLTGFITLELDIVQALTDSGFRWGPASWGMDVMHFEVMEEAAAIELAIKRETGPD